MVICSCKKKEEVNTSVPVLTTNVVVEITDISATCGGNIISGGGSAITEYGVCWTSSGTSPTINDQKSTDGSGTGSFTSTITGLLQGVTYYVRAYATNSHGTGYGNVQYFTTVGFPKVVTSAVINITDTTATCGGNITSDGGLAITERGVCWNSYGTSPTIYDHKSIDGSGTGIYTSTITGILQGVTYYVRAYATNSLGTSYGDVQNFISIGVPKLVTSADFANVAGNSATGSGSITSDGGSPVIGKGLCWSISPNPTLANSFSTDLSAHLTNLVPNTVYYVKAYAKNIKGTGYGNQVTFNSGYMYGFSYAGGLVFYNDGNGHGMVCAPTDQSSGAKWGCPGLFFGSGSVNIGAGLTNTNGIVLWCTTPNIAARICSDLSLNSYNDWYLPSDGELGTMDNNLNQQGLGGFVNTWYWSSSFEAGYDNAYARNIGNNGVGSLSRNDSYHVRAARNF